MKESVIRSNFIIIQRSIKELFDIHLPVIQTNKRGVMILKMNIYGVVSILAILLIAFIPLTVQAQDDDPKKVSFTLNSGVTYGSGGDGMVGRLAGNFNVPSFRQPIYGGSFQYAFSPAWSVDTAVQFGEFTNQYDFDPDYKNEFFYVTVRGVANMNGLFNLNSRFINPYFSVGMGMIRSKLESEDLDSEDLSLMLSGGAGLNFYLFRGADLFVQYTYNAAGSDLLDGFSGQGSSDQFAAVTGGLRFNFGSSGEKHISWPPSRDRRVADITPEEVEEEIRPREEPDPELIREREQMEERLRQRVERAEDAMMQRREEARIFADNWREERRRIQEEAQRRAQMFTDQPEPGHYVQVFSFRNQQSAETIRETLIEMLGDEFSNPMEMVVIQREGELNRVLVGAFSEFSEANRTLRMISQEYGDSFIITFPRPEE